MTAGRSVGRALYVGVDVRRVGLRPERRRGKSRDALRQCVEHSIPAHLCRSRWMWRQSGDAQFAVFSESERCPQVIEQLVRGLEGAVRRNNEQLTDNERTRLRVAMHLGPTTRDRTALLGLAMVPLRMLRARPLRKAMAAQEPASITLLLSDHAYQAMVDDGHVAFRPERFHRVRAWGRGLAGRGWLWLPPAGMFDDPATAPGGGSAVPPTTTRARPYVVLPTEEATVLPRQRDASPMPGMNIQIRHVIHHARPAEEETGMGG
jgi:hypothetical protein